MNIISRFLILATIFCFAIDCISQEQPNEELDPNAFVQHFAAQQSCKNYIEVLIAPVGQELASKKTLKDMRVWLSQHPKTNFAKLIGKVQHETITYGPLDPRLKSDRSKINSHILEALEELQGFKTSNCGPDVREYIMEYLYNVIGGENSLVSSELRGLGIEDSWCQRTVILAALMAGILVDEGISQKPN